MKWIVVLVAVAFGLTLSGAAFAGWSDSFESYTAGGVLTTPWDSSNAVHVLFYGYGGTQGASRYGYGEWDRYNAYRPADAGNTLTGRLYTAAAAHPYGTLGDAKASVGLTSAAPNVTGGLWGSYYYTLIDLSASGMASNTLYFDVSDPVQADNYHRTVVSNLAWDQWYDVKIVISGNTSTGYYKPTGATDWILIGAYDQPAGFAGYGYVGISSSRFGTIDDLSWGSGGAIAGIVTLQNFSSVNSRVAARIQLIQNSVVVRNENVMLGADGSYTIGNVPPGTYSVAFKAAQFLSKTVPNITVTGSETAPCSVALPNGDQDGDGEVTSTDLSLVLLNTGQTGN